MEFAPQSAKLNLYACCYALAVWAWTPSLTGAAVRLLGAERPAIRYLVDSSYWIYIVHIPVLAALQVLAHSFALPPLIKYGLTLNVLVLLLLLSYVLPIRHSFMGRWLNGRSHPWRGRGRTSDRLGKPAAREAATDPAIKLPRS